MRPSVLPGTADTVGTVTVPTATLSTEAGPAARSVLIASAMIVVLNALLAVPVSVVKLLNTVSRSVSTMSGFSASKLSSRSK